METVESQAICVFKLGVLPVLYQKRN